jgi:hypothetical protein
LSVSRRVAIERERSRDVVPRLGVVAPQEVQAPEQLEALQMIGIRLEGPPRVVEGLEVGVPAGMAQREEIERVGVLADDGQQIVQALDGARVVLQGEGPRRLYLDRRLS